MDFLKKHYEKILLGVVLIGLVAAIAYLPFKIGTEKANLEDIKQKYIDRPAKPLTNLDLTASEGALKRVTAPVLIDLQSSNKVFNPWQWQKAVDGRLTKVDKGNIGPNAVAVTKSTQLFLTLTFDSTTILESGP